MWEARLDVTEWVWISKPAAAQVGGSSTRMLERPFSPGAGFRGRLSARDVAFSLFAGHGANYSESFVFWREGLEKFLDAVGFLKPAGKKPSEMFPGLPHSSLEATSQLLRS
jgi:hypothetical protein